MLALSQLHKLEVESEALDMRVMVQRSRRTLRHLLSKSAADLQIPEDMPPAVGYGPWVEQIWTNYITNAIKYGGTPPRIEIAWTPSTDNMIRYMVRDNGRGLAPEEQAVVFNEFTRLNHIEIEGNGLGLAIVQRVASRMHGSVGLESKPGEGSTFYFCLPAA